MESGGLVVTGVGVVRVEPDAAVVRLGVAVTRGTVAEASADAAALASKVGDVLLAGGVHEEALRSVPVSVEPAYERKRGGKVFVGYQACRAISARVREQGSLDALLDEVIGLGGAEVSVEGIDFVAATIDERGPGGGWAVESARAAAFADARARAKQLAALAGLRLGAPLEIHEVGAEGASEPSALDGRASGAGAGASSGGGPAGLVAQQEAAVTRSVTVTVRYQLLESHSTTAGRAGH